MRRLQADADKPGLDRGASEMLEAPERPGWSRQDGLI